MGCPYKAIADDIRRKILTHLSHGEATSGDIASNFEITKPAVSNHLKVLQEADLVKMRKLMQNRLYSLNIEEIGAMRKFLDSLISCKNGNSK